MVKASSTPVIRSPVFKKSTPPDFLAATVDSRVLPQMPSFARKQPTEDFRKTSEEVYEEEEPARACQPPDEMSMFRHMDSFKVGVDFFELVERGGQEDCKEVERMLRADPSINMYGKGDPRLLANRKDLKGRTPLYLALRSNNVRMTRLLIEYGANVRLDQEGKKKPEPTDVNLLVLAVRWNFQEIPFLLEKGNWSMEELKAALAVADNRPTKMYLKERLRQKKVGKCYIF